MERNLDGEEAMKNTAIPLFKRMELGQGTSLICKRGKSLKTKPRRRTASHFSYFKTSRLEHCFGLILS